MRKRKTIAALLMFFILLCVPLQTLAATPVITDAEAWPTTCYYHYDGKIAVYTTSKYKAEVKKAIKLLNKKYNVFRYTRTASKSDVIIRDKKNAPAKSIVAQTWHYNGTILLYRKNMKKLKKKFRILAIAHELGHTAGLNHSSSRKSLMYPYVNRMKARGLSKADVAGLKIAKKNADNENTNREFFRKAFLYYEEHGYRIPLSYGAYILTFPKRGTTYKSSDTSILQVYHTGYIAAKNPGNVTLTVNNAGVKHTFKIQVR